MKSFQPGAALFITCLLLLGSITSSAQFVTIIRKIKSSHSENSEVSAVLLDAHTYKVYKAVTDTLGKAPGAKIIQKNDAKRFVEFSKGSTNFSLQVDSVDVKLAKITVTAKEQGEASPGARGSAVQVILAVSAKLGIKCTVEDK